MYGRVPLTSASHGVAIYELDRQYSHPEPLTYDERRREALQRIDEAKFSWFHVRACLVSGVGFFTDAYDIFAINLATTMILMVPRNPDDGNECRTVIPLGDIREFRQELGLKIATPIGTLVGQLLFGWLADLVGRKRMYGVELTFIIVSTIAQAMAGRGQTVSLIGTLIAWRFFMGIGIGGDYPLSAIITSEFAATRIRGRMMTAVFSMQGFGIFTAALVSLIVTQAHQSQLSVSPPDCGAIDLSWRLLIGLGAVPGVLALYFRLTIPETPRYTLDIERNVYQAVQDANRYLQTGDYDVEPEIFAQRVRAPRASWSDFARYFGQWKNGKILFGAAYAWFALDIAYYGLGLNASVVLGQLNHQSAGSSTYSYLRDSSIDSIKVSVAGLIPGYWATFFLVDSWGRKPIQLMGFTALTIIFVCMSALYLTMPNTAAKKALFALYCLANFFQNFGPNTTTFIVPGESFPTRYRSTAHGISAASGKLGAITSQVIFAALKERGNVTVDEADSETGSEADGKDIGKMFIVFAVLMLTGFLATLLIEETKGRTLEDLSNETQDGFISGGPGPLELHDGVVIDARTQMPLGMIQRRERHE